MAGVTGKAASNTRASGQRIGSGEEDWALCSCPPGAGLGQWLSTHLQEVPDLVSTHWLSCWKLKDSRGATKKKGGQEAAKKVPALVTEHSCFQDLREVLGRARPLPRHDAFFIAVDQHAGSTGALCPVPSNFPLLLKMGLCPNSHTVSVML